MKTNFGCCLVIGSFVPQNSESEQMNRVEQLKEGLIMLEKNNYDFAELTVQFLTQLSETEFGEAVKVIQQSALNIPVCNSFIPPQLKVVGPDVSDVELENYLHLAMKRVHEIGGKQIIFGSGGARTIPDGFSRAHAQEQIKQFLYRCETYGTKYGITVAIEPLNKAESNIINTVEEAIALAEEVDLPHIKVLADSYHMDLENESFNILKQAIKDDWISHVHISDRERRFPGEKSGKESIDFSKLFHVLQEAKYRGLISAECSSASFAEASALSLPFVRNTWAAIQGGLANVKAD
ncbi:sugar phosphate isomerase/epimerase [Lederbergia sp. NSJ-179]|uniref:sugar phosphate isomerase/epimerase family protein n=1 Tax=Lederbergia sp. NSJ-179 TaxID=2931402 RepID=UPI001FD04CFD|nr:sugar phosphate isomerase/epimerase family protein [Lederbergia sp. NSJ-179]MCJ7839411.1 sugar phosphate isomerase/epimerase [Lederbergia sp. NSJ-179]